MPIIIIRDLRNLNVNKAYRYQPYYVYNSIENIPDPCRPGRKKTATNTESDRNISKQHSPKNEKSKYDTMDTEWRK